MDSQSEKKTFKIAFLSFSRHAFLFIFLLSFILRLFLGLTFSNDSNSDYAVIIAQHLAANQGYTLDGKQPTAFRSPGYPLILTALIKVFGDFRIPLIILRAIIAAANTCLCAWLAMKIFNPGSGIIAGLLYAFIPYLAHKEAITELPFVIFGILSGLSLLWKSWKNKKIIWLVPAGLMFSFSYLIRPDIGILPFFFTFCMFIALRKKQKSVAYRASPIIFVLIFLLGISPWAIRNKIVFGRWYLGQTFFWYNVFIANHARTFQVYPAMSLDSFSSIIPLPNTPVLKDEFEKEDWYRKLAFTEINKLGAKNIVHYSLRKLFYLWQIRLVPYKKHLESGKIGDVDRTIAENLTFSIPYISLIAFALIGLWRERRRRGLILFTLGFLFIFSLPYITTFVAYSRYATQVYFVLIIFAARGITSLKRSINI